MKQELATSIDFYLQTQKTNPFTLHLSSNASSRDLITLRNQAFILNKLTLLNLEHPKGNSREETFEDQFLELYAISLDCVISNPLMPYKDLKSVQDLVHKIEHYHSLLEKLTFMGQREEEGHALRKKISLNAFWPRIRALLIAIEEKIPDSHQSIREYVTVRRGLLEPDKKYFLSQMMAKKVETKTLKDLIKKYQKEEQFEIQMECKQEEEAEGLGAQMKWQKMKKIVRMIPLINQYSDWKRLHEFLSSGKQIGKQEIEYMVDVLLEGLEVSIGSKGQKQYNPQQSKIIKEVIEIVQRLKIQSNRP